MLKLEIVTPERKVFDAEIDSVTVPTASGEAQILTNHAPLVSSLKAGVLTITSGGNVERHVVSGGFLEVSDNKVSVLANWAETASEIDAVAARSDLEAAEKSLALAVNQPFDGIEHLRDQLETATARLQLAAGK
ncbi:MAG: ATP synthase F1 subunit epsilon [Acidobacteria bacterium]|nr:ATP synthase F1 subunit epsilon [Acidobacteriota bacterium]MCA1608544.1 ATP synthase F1 subunit epsilon [Acidobacteriota bacterium]